MASPSEAGAVSAKASDGQVIASSSSATANPTKNPSEAEWKDCMSCRLTGAATFIGLGSYAYVTGHRQLREDRMRILRSKSRVSLRMRHASITTMSLALIATGVYRLVM